MKRGSSSAGNLGVSFSRSVVVQNKVWSKHSRRIVPIKSFTERMRQRNVRNCFDFRYVQNPQVRLPLMKPVQRIVIGAQIFWKDRTSNRLFEHATKLITVDNSCLNCKSDDSSRVLIHHQQQPIGPQCHGFTSK